VCVCVVVSNKNNGALKLTEHSKTVCDPSTLLDQNTNLTVVLERVKSTAGS